MSICHPATDWSCRFSMEELEELRANPAEEALLERSEAFAWSLLASLTAYNIGTCPVTVRPCAAGCLPQGGYTAAPVRGGSYAAIPVVSIGRMSPYISGGNWYNACGCSTSDCSCTSISEVLLPGPVGRIESVMLGGVPLDRSAYRVDNGYRLVRTDGEPWPACQDMAAASGEEGSFEVTYYRGAAPNIMTQAAAGALADEFYKSCKGETCRLPWNITSRTVQGDSMDFGEGGIDGVAESIPEVAAVVRVYNPNGLKTRPAIYSPDARKTRTTTWP